MADLIKDLKVLNWGGVSYNTGWSKNDFNDAYKAQLDGLNDSLDGAKNGAITASAVTIAEAAGTGNILKTYTFSQNGAEIGKINLAKDLVVSGGEIVEKEGEKYLSLSIANQEAPVEIPVKDLVDVYTGSTYINITDGNVVELKVADLDAHLAAEGSAVGNKLKANAEAAAAADGKAQTAQSEIDALEKVVGKSDDAANAGGSVFAQINKVKEEISSLTGGEGSVATQIDNKLSAYDTATVQPHIADNVRHITAEERTAWNAAKSTADANKSKLDGITAGANKVSSSYDEVSATLTITIE